MSTKKATFPELVLFVLYLPVTLILLMCGVLRESVLTATGFGELFTAYVLGYPCPILGLLTYPCLFWSISLRKHGKLICSRWVRFATPLAFIVLFCLCFLMESLF